MSLGKADDITALLDVLNEIQDGLSANSNSISEMCTQAEGVCGVDVPPFDDKALQAELADEEAKVKMSLRRMDTSLLYLAEIHDLLLQFSRVEIIRVLSLHQQCCREQEKWQLRVNTARSECVELELAALEIDKRLVKAFSDLRNDLSI